MSRVRILVVASDESVQRAIFDALVPAGFEVATIASGARALTMAEGYHPDVLIVDPEVSGLNGLELVKQLRSRPDTFLIPAIFLAEHRVVGKALQGFTLGADDTLSKPLRTEDLVPRVKMCLKRQEKTRAIFLKGGKPKDPSLSEMMATFKGSLDELGLPSLLNMLEMERKTGTLRVTLQPDGMKVRVYFRDGHAVQARLEDIERPRDAELIYFLLGTARGKFGFTAGPIVQEDNINLPVAQLLLEGARRQDERGRKKQA